MSAPSGPTAQAWAAAQLAGWEVSDAHRDLAAAPDPVDSDPVDSDPVADWAESGAVTLTGFPDRPPVVPPGAAATAARGAQRAFAALGGGCVADTDWRTLLGERAAHAGLARRAPFSPGGSCRAVACADGWVAVSLPRADDVASIPALLETSDGDLEVATAWQRLDDVAATSRSADLVARAELLGLPVAAIPAPGRWVARDRLEPGRPSQPVRRQEIAAGPRGRQEPPLVVDFSALWAGPLCARLLGEAGARVVKVEWRSRPDGARRGPARFYDALHPGHEAVAIEPDAVADRALLEEILERADIVVEAARPRALVGLGVDATEVCRRSPTTWVSITAYGRTAPMRVGFGDDVAMAAGLASWTRDSVGPIPSGDAIADPLTGMHAAVAALASYRTGGSRVLDIAMSDVVAATVAWHPAGASVARRDGDTWVVDGPSGPHIVREPTTSPPIGIAAGLGEHTDRWRPT